MKNSSIHKVFEQIERHRINQEHDQVEALHQSFADNNKINLKKLEEWLRREISIPASWIHAHVDEEMKKLAEDLPRLFDVWLDCIPKLSFDQYSQIMCSKDVFVSYTRYSTNPLNIK